MTPYELAKFLEIHNPEIVNLVRKERPYKIPKNYLQWRALSAIIALCLDTFEEKALTADLASYFNANRTALWFLQDAPIYCLKKELLRALEKSTVEDNAKLLADLNAPLPTFMLLFPENSLISPEGGALDYCVVHVSSKSHPEWSQAFGFGYNVKPLKQEHETVIHYCGADSKEVVWFSGRGVEADGSSHYSRRSLGAHPTNDADEEFMAKIRNIIIQCLLAMTYEPHLLEAENAALRLATKNIRTHKPEHNNEIRYPRWLGKEYQPKRVSNSVGSHASPAAHWRSGHWKRVVVGARVEGQRKWVWIQPLMVNS